MASIKSTICNAYYQIGNINFLHIIVISKCIIGNIRSFWLKNKIGSITFTRNSHQIEPIATWTSVIKCIVFVNKVIVRGKIKLRHTIICQCTRANFLNISRKCNCFYILTLKKRHRTNNFCFSWNNKIIGCYNLWTFIKRSFILRIKHSANSRHIFTCSNNRKTTKLWTL